MERDAGFGELFRAEYPALVRELTIVLADRQTAEDVASDAFEQALKQWPTVRTYDRPGAWVRMIAFRIAGRARWRRARGRALEAGASTEPVTGPGPDLDLAAALGRLPFTQRAAVVLHHYAGWPAAEIAGVLGCSPSTVRTHLLRGRNRLNELLAEPAPHPGGAHAD
jgi:RNA polymerase sigma-70 factor (ECF subfamily)